MYTRVSSALMHVGINSLLYIFLHMSYVFTCFCISRWFRIHSTSAYNLAEGQVVILEGRKLGNYLGGGKKEAVLFTIFRSKKNPVLWELLYVVYVGCGFFLTFFFNGEE